MMQGYKKTRRQHINDFIYWQKLFRKVFSTNANCNKNLGTEKVQNVDDEHDFREKLFEKNKIQNCNMNMSRKGNNIQRIRGGVNEDESICDILYDKCCCYCAERLARKPNRNAQDQSVGELQRTNNVQGSRNVRPQDQSVGFVGEVNRTFDVQGRSRNEELQRTYNVQGSRNVRPQDQSVEYFGEVDRTFDIQRRNRSVRPQDQSVRFVGEVNRTFDVHGGSRNEELQRTYNVQGSRNVRPRAELFSSFETINNEVPTTSNYRRPARSYKIRKCNR